MKYLFQVPQNWGSGVVNFAEGDEIGILEIPLDTHFVKTESLNVNISVFDESRTICECTVHVIDDICKYISLDF